MELNVASVIKQVALYGRRFKDCRVFVLIYHLTDLLMVEVELEEINELLSTNDLPKWESLKDLKLSDVAV